MSHSKRLCRLKGRPADRNDALNYSNDAAFKKAKVRRALQRASRKAARGR